jgi:FtsP/CotA-like multicopper oxidase with cupredoxin domain
MDRRKFIAATAATLISPRFLVSEAEAGYIILSAEKTDMPILGKGGNLTPTYRFEKDKPVAIIRAKQGLEFNGRFINNLDQDVWLHWFGVRGNSEAMTISATPGNGNSVDIKFTPPDAGTFWFGPVVHSSEQRDMGLYGMLIVEEAQYLDFTEVPLILDDWSIDEAGKHKGKFGDLEAAIGEGRMGNWFTLNGEYKPHVSVDRAKPVRLRILNVANVRNMNVLFKGADVYVMALDGQPLPLKALGLEALKLAPGQRADVLLNEITDQVTVALDLFEDVVEIGYLEPVGKTVPHELPDNFALPPNPVAQLGDLKTARHVPVIIAGGAKGGLKSAKVGDVTSDLRGLLEKGLAWAFNGIAGPGGPNLFEAKKGETIVLEIENSTSFPQPIHIHGHVWKLIMADGEMLENQTWRDTAVVPGLGKVQLALVCDNIGLWGLQSLVAERLDAGLFGAFEVTPELP